MTPPPPPIPWFLVPTLAIPWFALSPYLLGIVEPVGMVFYLVQSGLLLLPAVVAVALTLWRRPAGAADLGLRLPRRSILGVMGLAFALPIASALVALGAAHLLGWYSLDLLDLSGLRAELGRLVELGGGDGALLTGKPLVAHALLWTGVVLGPFAYGLFALGEELGWRGWLVPRLLPWGRWRAWLLSAACWGLWALPMVALLPETRSAPLPAVGFFLGYAMVWGLLLGWMRTVTDSVWPCALLRGSLYVGAGLYGALHLQASHFDPLWVGLTSPIAWTPPLVALACIAVLGARSAPAPNG